MVITHEPTFYSHEDKTDALKDDPTYRFKQEFLDRTTWLSSAFTTTGTLIARMALQPG